MPDPALPLPPDARPGEIRRLEATVVGAVQGVGFRWFVMAQARQLGLGGWVANAPDGTVQCVAEGPVEALAELLLQLGRGPAGGWVERVIPLWLPATGPPRSFEIRSGYHRGD
jgi:acylphosphatase